MRQIYTVLVIASIAYYSMVNTCNLLNNNANFPIKIANHYAYLQKLHRNNYQIEKLKKIKCNSDTRDSIFVYTKTSDTDIGYLTDYYNYKKLTSNRDATKSEIQCKISTIKLTSACYINKHDSQFVIKCNDRTSDSGYLAIHGIYNDIGYTEYDNRQNILIKTCKCQPKRPLYSKLSRYEPPAICMIYND